MTLGDLSTSPLSAVRRLLTLRTISRVGLDLDLGGRVGLVLGERMEYADALGGARGWRLYPLRPSGELSLSGEGE